MIRTILLLAVVTASGCSSLDSDLGHLVQQNTEKIVAAINNHEARLTVVEKKEGIIKEETKPDETSK